LWGIFVYRRFIQQLMTSAGSERVSIEQLAAGLGLATQVVAAPDQELILQQAMKMIRGLLSARLIAIGLINEPDQQAVQFHHVWPPATATRDGRSAGQRINLAEGAAFRLARERQRGIQLLPRGVGARQVHELAQHFSVDDLGPVYIEPLIVQDECLGFILLGASKTANEWSEEERLLIPELGRFIAQAIVSGRRHENCRTEEAARLQKQLEIVETRTQLTEVDASRGPLRES
jgi:GAF domain-containing protein